MDLNYQNPRDNAPPGPAPSGGFPPPLPVRRCLDCYYVLDNLPGRQCPECGRAFDPLDPDSFTTKPPFVWWTYWLPGVLLATGLGIVTYLCLIPFTGFGWAATLAVPFMIGGVVGYAVRLPIAISIALAVLALGGALTALFIYGSSGVFCTMILTAMAAVPMTISVLIGWGLRMGLKGSRWSQREWLPILVFFLLPFGVAGVESRFPSTGEVAVETVRVIDAPTPAAWDGVMFYEEVTHDPPWLLKLGLRRPLFTTGSTANVGDRKTCVYTRGHLTKEVTARRPNEALEFKVVEQDMFEDYSVRLTGGSFKFEPVDGGARTRVTLTTRYRPLLHPRWAWGPVEERVVHDLHGHVLEGMAREAARRGQVAASR